MDPKFVIETLKLQRNTALDALAMLSAQYEELKANFEKLKSEVPKNLEGDGK